MKINFANKTNIIKVIPYVMAAICLCIQVTTLVCTVKLLEEKEATAAAYKPAIVTSSQDIYSNAMYRLYECGGKIGIYDAKSDILVDIIDVFASSLPDADRIALKKGIEIYSLSELAQIIDDFTS